VTELKEIMGSRIEDSGFGIQDSGSRIEDWGFSVDQGSRIND